MKLRLPVLRRAFATTLGLTSLTLFVAATLASVISLADVAMSEVSSVTVVRDVRGMPKCIAIGKADGLIFSWKEKEEYQRDIFAAHLKTLAGRDRSNSSGGTVSCANFKSLASQVNDKDIKWDGTAQIEGIALPADLVKALKQAAQGGNLFHEEETAAAFLAAHPISKFTKEMNRSLAQKYGIGFTAEIYRSFLELRPEYKALEFLMDEHLKSPSIVKLGERAPELTIMLANGYMQAPMNNRLKTLQDQLAAQGLKVVVFKLDTIGALKTNVAFIKQQIIEEAAKSKSLILIGGSKGVPELLGAVAELGVSNPNVVMQIRSVVNLSGMIDGSFIVDWGTKFPQKIFVEKQMKKQGTLLGINMHTMDGFKDMGSKVLGEFVPPVVAQLPPSVTYFNILGVPGGNGLVREKPIAQIQNQVSRVHIGLQGANDGYIEFPGTEIPNDRGLKLYTLAFNGSHVILDGWYKEHDLLNPEELKSVLNALFNAILDLAP